MSQKSDPLEEKENCEAIKIEKDDNSPVDEGNQYVNEPSKNPVNSPSEKSSSFNKSESIDLTSTQQKVKNPQVFEEEKKDEEDEDDDDDDYENGEEEKDNSKYLGFNFSDLESIKSYVLEYKQLCEKFESDFTNPEILEYYILSESFLKEWKEFVSYEEFLKGEPPCKNFAKNFPEYFNKDLLENDEKTDMEAIYRNEEEKCVLKQGLSEGVDFKIVNKEIMDFFKHHFHGIEIPRKAYILPNGLKRIEIYYKKVQFILITNQVLRDADLKAIKSFTVNYTMVFSQKKLQDFKEAILEYVQAKYSRRGSYISSATTYKIDQLRLWKLDSEISLAEAFDYVKKICNNYTSYDYRIEMKGKFLENDLEMKFDHLNLQSNEYLIVEIREESKGWNFIQEGVPFIEKCEYCNKYDSLKIFCACKKVCYCSEECRFKDKRFHSMRCEKTDEEELENLTLGQNSRYGLTGLSNLGNTCFMNSALQCISHTYHLTKYFIENRYFAEINEKNPLGSKGKLTEKYTILLKNLWLKPNPVFSPYGIKTALAQLNPMFSGYNQHDSQEFLSYLLDGLHEDLNRVQTKPYTETIESDGRPDDIVAAASWFNHLKRNNSIITDLMHGQYKSKIICPDCHHVSITFDPFLTCTLPLPTKEKQKIDFFFIFADNHRIPIKIELWFKKRNHFLSNLKEQVIVLLKSKNIINLVPKAFNFYFLSNSSCTKVHPSTATNEVRKKRKMGSLFAIEMEPEMLKYDDNEIVEVPITFNKNEHYYSSYYNKRPFTFIRPFHFLKTDTTNQIHLRIFRYFRFYFEEVLAKGDASDKEERLKSLEEFNSLNDLEAFAKYFGKPDERPYDILLSTNARSYLSCYFCGEYRCENCKLSESDTETLNDLLNKIKSKDFLFEMEVYWPNPPCNIVDVKSRFNDFERLEKETPEKELTTPKEEEKNDEEESKTAYYGNNKKPFIITKNMKGDEKTGEMEEKNLYECFKLFSEPETLNAENAWYCSRCKSHKEATKEMKIYKSSKYLILHLKRFKGGESILSAGKISTKINFPTTLDLTDIVMNHELPTEYKDVSIELNSKENPIEDKKNENKSEMILEEQNNDLNKDKIEEEKGDVTQAPKENTKLIYRLYAVSNHYGSVGFGHYTAFALHSKDNSWYCFDDSSVNKVTEEQVITPAAYILFYERVDEKNPDEKSLEFNILPPPTQNVSTNTTQTTNQNSLVNNNNNNENVTANVTISVPSHVQQTNQSQLMAHSTDVPGSEDRSKSSRFGED